MTKNNNKTRTGLVLSGGGARAAYQVGVLRAVSETLPRETKNPFPIICGTSAGAINALAIAGRAGPFSLRIKKLEAIWRQLDAEKVYRTDFIGVFKNSFNMLMSFFHSGYAIGRPKALLDNTPLKELLDNYIRFRHIDEAIANGELEAVSITAMSYSSGKSVTFFQGGDHIQPWQKTRQVGLQTELTINHLMASSAIPIMFPALKLDEHYFGDGALRQLKPISPALRLGAEKVFVIGVSDSRILNQGLPPSLNEHSPSIAQIIGHMFNSAFIDTIESDLETLNNINRLAQNMTTSERERKGLSDLKPIKYLAILPSQSINRIASDYLDELPKSIRLFLRITGATTRGGGVNAASYLLFCRGFCRKLLELGYQDGLAQREAILDFFEGDE
ncbi:patatin-like phospholipase family protein [Porticoccus sp.]